jgi:hypothetical protein
MIKLEESVPLSQLVKQLKKETILGSHRVGKFFDAQTSL